MIKAVRNAVKRYRKEKQKHENGKCELCTILIGPNMTHPEYKIYKYRGRSFKLCGSCYKEAKEKGYDCIKWIL